MPPNIVEGDPFGPIKKDVARRGPEPREVNEFHSRDDCDTGNTAHHHTIGIKHDQASAGDHSHDGVTSRKVGVGLNLTINTGVSTAADLAVLLNMLHSVIEFTET